jgi:hypothetical protein
MNARTVLTAVAMAVLVPGDGLAQAVLNVTVEGDGKFITVPDADEYSVKIANAEAPVLSVSCPSTPLSLLVLVDMSHSATHGGLNAGRGDPETRGIALGASGHDFPGLVDTIKNRLLRALGPDDRVRVGGFAGQTIRLSERFTTDREEQRVAVDAVLNLGTIGAADRFGASPIWDAVANGVEHLAAEPGSRAVLLITDGHAKGNRLGMIEVARLATEVGVPVHVLFEPSWIELEAVPYEEGDRFLRPLAKLTGGIFRVDERLKQLTFGRTVPSSFQEILDAVHRTCTLSFGPDTSPGAEVSVEVRQAGAVVHAPQWLTNARTRP